MKRLPVIAWLAAAAALLFSPEAKAQSRAAYEKMVAVHAHANGVPEALVHRVIVRESKYHPDLIGRGGTIGLMQIKLATARGVGYQGDAEGLRDPETNLTYGVKYLAGAYRAAQGDHDRTVRLYAAGYYEVAKRQRLARPRQPEPVLASAPPKDAEPAKEASVELKQSVSEPKEAAVDTAVPAEAEPEQTEKPTEAVKPREVAARPKGHHAAKPKPPPGPLVLTPILAKLKSVLTPSPKAAHKKLADAKERVPRPSAGMAASSSSGANAAQPR
ncbi:Transglycosylase SLT domain-containing protein [Afipia sp. GAS231]|nr:Transglycosylase SLT domain-containing protein [Afipia sp. GAS231]